MNAAAQATLVYIAGSAEVVGALEHRLAGQVRLIIETGLGDPRWVLQGIPLASADSLVIDQRRHSPAQRLITSRLALSLRRSCRVLIIRAKHDALIEPALCRLQLIVEPTEPVAAFIAAVHHGLGRHEVLIEAMRVLAPHLTAYGRALMIDILSSRFACRNVNGLAALQRMERTRLHRMLVNRGDPSPKQLFDWCHAIVTLLLLRRSAMRLCDIARFLRVTHQRVPSEAVYRCTGTRVTALRSLRTVPPEAVLVERILHRHTPRATSLAASATGGEIRLGPTSRQATSARH